MDDQLALGNSLSLRILIVSCSSPNSAINNSAFLCEMRTYGLSEVDNLSANLPQNENDCGGGFSIYLYAERNDFADCTTNQFYSDATILSLGKDKKVEECKSKELTTDPCGCCKVLATPTSSN